MRLPAPSDAHRLGTCFQGVVVGWWRHVGMWGVNSVCLQEESTCPPLGYLLGHLTSKSVDLGSRAIEMPTCPSGTRKGHLRGVKHDFYGRADTPRSPVHASSCSETNK